ncbi:MAG: PaaI family thioesterase [Actinomycetota bacterium]
MIPERPPLPADEVEAAAAVRRLAGEMLGRTLDPELSAAIARVVNELADRASAAPARTKAEAFARYTGHQRIEHFLDTGTWPDPPDDGDPVLFDALSFVGGALSPIGGGAEFAREGDRAVARVRFGPSYEGPPTRVHGGMLAATFDEVMGALFRVLGLPSAFTASLTVRYEAPAPLGADLVFAAWLEAVDGRKFTVRAEGTGPDGRFASADALFIEMSAAHLSEALDPGANGGAAG